MDGAGWERTLALPDGEALVERGILLDSAAALLLSWHPVSGDWGNRGQEGILLELDPPGGRPPLKVTLPPGNRAVSIAVLPPGTDPEALRPRLHPPNARARARRNRWPAEGRVTLSGPEGPLLEPPLEALDRSPTGVDPDGRPVGPFLVGVAEGRPRFARGGELVELGLGLTLAGRHEAAWAVLDAAVAPQSPADADVSPLATLHLASELALWTGNARPLLRHRDRLDGLLDRIGGGDADPTHPGAAFPGPGRLLDRFAQAVEPLGGQWREAVKARRSPQASAEPGPDGSHHGPPGPKRLRLPVVGGGAPEAEPPPLDDRRPPSLPAPRAFQPIGGPGTAARRGLLAARLVRSWIEGVLGAGGDAAFGRLTLAPDLRNPDLPGAFELQGLRLGHGRVSLACRLEGPICTFGLFQEGGAVPINLVFQPFLPLEPPVTVHLDDREAEVTTETVDGGVRLSCQLPLDSQRRMVVERTG
jgi:hypothetical protein